MNIVKNLLKIKDFETKKGFLIDGKNELFSILKNLSDDKNGNLLIQGPINKYFVSKEGQDVCVYIKYNGEDRKTEFDWAFNSRYDSFGKATNYVVSCLDYESV